MRKQFKLLLLLAIVALVVFQSCKDDKEEDPTPAINPLTANAGNDTTMLIGESLTLDGSESKDKEGGTFSYSWSIKSKPENSQATLEKATTSSPVLTPDKTGAFVLELTIMKDQWVSTDQVKVNVSSTNNQEAIEISEDINSDLVLEDIFTDDWHKVDYIVTAPINVTAKLTVKPGVRIAFAENTGMMVTTTGAFIAEGGETEETMVYLTGAERTHGYWVGILIQSPNAENTMKYTSLEFAGANPEGDDFSAGMYLDEGAKISIENSSFSGNMGMCLFISPDATLSSFSENVLVGNVDENFVVVLPATEVGKIENNNEIWNASIGVLTSDLNEGGDVEWGSYYYILLSGLDISNNTNLTIREGAVIYVVENERIGVLSGASINAVSTEAMPTVFTGYIETAGYWKGIYIENSSNNHSIFKHVIVRYAGSTPLAGEQEATIHLGPNGKVAIDHCSIAFGAGDGVEATSEGATLVSFSTNSIREHQGYPIAVSTKNVPAIDYNTYFINNTKNQVRIDGNMPIAEDQETVWNGFMQTNMSYHIKGLSNDLVVWSGLKLSEGVILEMESGSRINVEDANGRQGYLHAEGAEDKNIVIKNADEVAGSWYGIIFSSSNAQNFMSYVQVLHGGKKVDNSFSANITIDNSPEGSLTIKNSIIGHSGQHGIAIANTMREKLADQNITYDNIPESPVYSW